MKRIAPKPPIAIDGPIIRQSIKPAHLSSNLTRTEDLFILAHTSVPKIDKTVWSFEIGGLIDRNLTITYEDLTNYPKDIIEVIHKCSGSPLEPTIPTRQVANVKWGGVYLKTILDDREINSSATHLWAYGLDYGNFVDNEVTHYLKDVPVSKVFEGNIMIAYELNDKPLAPQNGFPARLIIPGYYGTNLVKWLCRLEFANRRPDGLFTTKFYNDTDQSGKSKPVWDIEPESIFVSPLPDEKIKKQELKIWGRAWSSSTVTSVEVSFDSGKSWENASIEPNQQYSWQKFSIKWTPPKSGNYKLQCRATDDDGRIQPPSGARNAIYSVDIIIK